MTSSNPVPELTLACAPYDRMVPLLTGEVPIPGVRLRAVPIRRPTEVFSRMINDRAFDVAEMSLSQCFVHDAFRDGTLAALPVFPSRAFRLGFIFVNRHAGITGPRDLAGRRIGVQHYGMSAAVWIRSALRGEYGVDLSGVTWVEGPVNGAGAEVPVSRAGAPAGVVIETVRQPLSDLLADGRIDALLGAWVPDSFRRSADVVRLFPDSRAEEQRYFRRTGIFPIMHALAIRSELLTADPDLARHLFDACVMARDVAFAQHRSTGALSVMLPWLHDDIDEIDALFGADFWPYGREANRKVLERFAGELVLDRALAEAPPVDEVFVPLG